MKNKNILIICEGDLHRDPRVLKQILSFREEAKVYTVGYNPSGLEDHFFSLLPLVTNIKDSFLSKIKRIMPYFFNYMEYYTWRGETIRQVVYNIKAKNIHFDLIIANELRPLPIAFAVASKKTKIHWDAHEYYLNDTLPDTVREIYHKYDKHLLLNYAIKANTLSTVCFSIAQEYKKMFKKEIMIMENVPLYVKQMPGKVDLNNIKIIYHGIAMKNRSIDKIIKGFESMPANFSLYLALVPFEYEPETYKEIIELASANKRITILSPFQMTKISEEINKFDISLCFFEKTTKSVEYALPNKFFEGIQGRLCMAISPNPEMKRIIELHSLGITSDGYDIVNLFNKIAFLTPDEIYRYKQNSDKVALVYSFENIKHQYTKLLA
ncbi:MAG: glycosyltransferase family protein [Bacteroidia bacterium]